MAIQDTTDALSGACERALVRGARTHATRQQVRAAARAFVRRHRRDAGYLAWVLRAVGASSALAIALLGLAAAPAAAQLAPFQLRPTNLDPQDIGVRSTPALGDLDGDGDLDVVAGGGTGGFFYFENTGGPEAPAFSAGANPLAGQTIGVARSAAVLADLNGDGDLDLLSGMGTGAFAYFENTGSATAPAFAARTGVANPLNGQDIGTNSQPAFGDLDGDGDLDLVTNDELTAGGFDYYENTGDAATPVFVSRTGAANPLNGLGTLGNSPALVDLDRDGDLDLVSGSQSGTFRAFENTGSATTPAFVELTDSANPLVIQDAGIFSMPTFGDLDGDGDPDLVSGNYDGTFQTIRNSAGKFVTQGGPANPLNGVDLGGGGFSTPAFGDLDADGDFDVLTGFAAPQINYFENTGNGAAPAYVLRTGAANPLNGRTVTGGYTAPVFGDLDGDGDLDVVSGNGTGGLLFHFLNTGTAVAPAFTGTLGMSLSGLGGLSRPALGDLDGDGDLDLLAGSAAGTLRYFEHTGAAVATAFVERSGAGNPFDGVDIGSNSAPALIDVEGDGDLDVVAGAAGGTLLLFENTGRATSPAFLARTGAANPLSWSVSTSNLTPTLADLDGDGDPDALAGSSGGNFFCLESFVARAPGPALQLTGLANPLGAFDVGALSAPAFADLDADGDLDAIAGEDLGAIRHFENTGTLRTPAFAARTGAANPLDGRDVGDGAQPVVGDLDGDGDGDVLAGRSAGDFDYFANTGDAVTPLFAAGVANPFGLASVGSTDSAPVFADLDRDGDLDLVVGRYYGGLAYLENTGDATAPAFAERTGAANPFDGLDVAYYARPALADFDRDGDLDLVSGTEAGRLRYFQNVGSATAPSFARGFGAANPLDGEDVGDRAAPAAADLDGDGDSDLVTGSLAGTFAVHYFPEPSRTLLVAAGVALLRWLRRRAR